MRGRDCARGNEAIDSEFFPFTPVYAHSNILSQISLSHGCPALTPSHSFTLYVGMYTIFSIPPFSLTITQDRIPTLPTTYLIA